MADLVKSLKKRTWLLMINMSSSHTILVGLLMKFSKTMSKTQKSRVNMENIILWK